MAPKVFNLTLRGQKIPVTVSKFEYPVGGWLGVLLYNDGDWGPIWDAVSVNLIGQAGNPGPRRFYVKSYQDGGREAAEEYELLGILRILDWKAVPMPFGKYAALAELCVADEDLAPYKAV